LENDKISAAISFIMLRHFAYVAEALTPLVRLGTFSWIVTHTCVYYVCVGVCVCEHVSTG